MPFAKNMGKCLSNKYGQKLLDSAKRSTTDAIKTASKRAIQKTEEATGDLIDNKIADKITSVSKKPAMELHSKELPNNSNNNNNNNNNEKLELTAHKEDTYLTKKDNKLLMN